jgi:LacI family transcriptional regulator
MPRKDKTALNGIKEIARQARVSIATVDRVIHNRTGVSEKTKEKIKAIIGALNYQPNIFARQLASRKKIEFAVLIPQVSAATSYWKAPIEGVLQAEKELMPLGISISRYLYDQQHKESFNQAAKKILKKKPAGVLLAPLFVKDTTAFVKACVAAKIQCVFIDADLPAENRLCYIGGDLYQSGMLAGHLIKYSTPDKTKVLVLNISDDLGEQNSQNLQHRLLQKEAGIRAYFEKYKSPRQIITLVVPKTEALAVEKQLLPILAEHKNIGCICVTNSRISTVAGIFEKRKIPKPMLLGYDVTEANIDYLKKGTIDFLLCDKPQEQGYRGMMVLYQRLVLGLPIESIQFMPIDIITRENYMYYQEGRTLLQ